MIVRGVRTSAVRAAVGLVALIAFALASLLAAPQLARHRRGATLGVAPSSHTLSAAVGSPFRELRTAKPVKSPSIAATPRGGERLAPFDGLDAYVPAGFVAAIAAAVELEACASVPVVRRDHQLRAAQQHRSRAPPTLA